MKCPKWSNPWRQRVDQQLPKAGAGKELGMTINGIEFLLGLGKKCSGTR